MDLFNIFALLIYFQQSLSFNISPGAPVPHANELDEILEATLFRNYNETDAISIFDYLFRENFTILENAQVSEHLDISLLSPENIKKVVDEAQKKYELVSRSYNESLKGDLRRHVNTYDIVKITKAMDWMKQTIYGTRRRLEGTRPYRKKFLKNISYNIGILYGILTEMVYKVDSLYAAMKRIHPSFNFIWFLIPYQRILAFNVDITYIVERIYQFQKKWKRIGTGLGGGSEEEQIEGAMSPDNGLPHPDLAAVLPDLEAWINMEVTRRPNQSGPGGPGASPPPSG